MSTYIDTFSGTVRGNRIELDQTTDLPDGAKVVVSVKAAVEEVPEKRANGLLRAFGACAGEADEVDKFLLEYRELRRGIFPGQ